VKNQEYNLINDFGNEWDFYKQDREDLSSAFNEYFHIFPKKFLNKNSEGFDMGCGSGRWAKFIAPKVKLLNCIEPSKKALKVTKNNLKNYSNCRYENASASNSKLKNNSQDFGYCLGVLHHTTNPEEGLKKCIMKLKKGSPFLIYLYYRFDNRPKYYYWIWSLTIIPRKIISSLPFQLKIFITRIISLFIYLPLAKSSKLLKKFGLNIKHFPLWNYSNKSFYFMQTDALDRFGTKIEKRFTKKEIIKMMNFAGLERISFSKTAPYWVALGYKQ
tara:strand:- start:1204 stop:2022 length:819 start_codon:yes stop_codon:yes gene_type:complete